MQGSCRLPAAAQPRRARPTGRPVKRCVRESRRSFTASKSELKFTTRTAAATTDVGHRRLLGLQCNARLAPRPRSPAAGGRRLNQCPAGPQTEKRTRRRGLRLSLCSSLAPRCFDGTYERERSVGLFRAVLRSLQHCCPSSESVMRAWGRVKEHPGYRSAASRCVIFTNDRYVALVLYYRKY